MKCWQRNLCKGISRRNLIYSASVYDGTGITSVSTQQLNNGLGIVVTGSSVGAIKVWNIDSSDAICTVSRGGIIY